MNARPIAELAGHPAREALSRLRAGSACVVNRGETIFVKLGHDMFAQFDDPEPVPFDILSALGHQILLNLNLGARIKGAPDLKHRSMST